MKGNPNSHYPFLCVVFCVVFRHLYNTLASGSTVGVVAGYFELGEMKGRWLEIFGVCMQA